MSDKRWLLLKPSEDGNPLIWITDVELSRLLAHPSERGINEFCNLNGEDCPDPNYWPRGMGVLLRVEVVVPERGGWRLPCADLPSPSGYDLIKGDLRGEGGLMSWYENGMPVIDDPDVLATTELIRRLYTMPGGGLGGRLHVVLDDGNYEDEQINSGYYRTEDGRTIETYLCRAEFVSGRGWVHHDELECTPEMADSCRLILASFRRMPESWRAAAIAWFDGRIARKFPELVAANPPRQPTSEELEVFIAELRQDIARGDAPPEPKPCTPVPCPPIMGVLPPNPPFKDLPLSGDWASISPQPVPRDFKFDDRRRPPVLAELDRHDQTWQKGAWAKASDVLRKLLIDGEAWLTEEADPGAGVRPGQYYNWVSRGIEPPVGVVEVLAVDIQHVDSGLEYVEVRELATGHCFMPTLETFRREATAMRHVEWHREPSPRVDVEQILLEEAGKPPKVLYRGPSPGVHIHEMLERWLADPKGTADNAPMIVGVPEGIDAAQLTSAIALCQQAGLLPTTGILLMPAEPEG